MENIQKTGASELVTPHKMRATEFTGKLSVGMFFHDAGHTEKDILEDFTFWRPQFLSPMWFALHDFVGKTWNKDLEKFVETIPRVTHQKFFDQKILPGAKWSSITLTDTLWSGKRKI